MGRFEKVFVSYCQMQVAAEAGAVEPDDALPTYTVGDHLVHVTGARALTVFTGVHTDWVDVRVRELDAEPTDDPAATGWEAATEATLWCPKRRLAVIALMDGGEPKELNLKLSGGPGLYRVQARARHRQPEGAGYPNKPRTEEYEILAWPVPDETRLRTLLADDLSCGEFTPDLAVAATWAVGRLVAPTEPALDPLTANLLAQQELFEPPKNRKRRRRELRVDVRRSIPLPGGAGPVLQQPIGWLGAATDGDDLIVPAGEWQIRLRRTQAFDVDGTAGLKGTAVSFSWQWEPASDPAIVGADPAPSTVELQLRTAGTTTELSVRHRDVRARDAVALGLLWEHLLTRAAGADGPVNPWLARFAAEAAKAAEEAEEERRLGEEQEAREWGGRPLTHRLRGLGANTWGLAQLDRDLLDTLAEATPELQREVARWAAHQACAVAGLAEIDWVAAALTALTAGDPLPPPFQSLASAFDRLLSDERVPRTTVQQPFGMGEILQQAVALPAVPAAVEPDPLVAAVDALFAAVIAYGVPDVDLLAAARIAFPVLNNQERAHHLDP